MDLKATTFGVCSRLDQADSDWERAGCLCLTAHKGNLLLLLSKKHHKKKLYALRGDRGEPTYCCSTDYLNTPIFQRVTNLLLFYAVL